MASIDPAPPRRPLGWLKKIVPVLISLALIWYYFHGYFENPEELEKLRAAFSRISFWDVVLFIALPQIFFWFVEVLVWERHLFWFHKKVSYRDFFWTRGAIYILMFVNTALGSGGILLYVKSKAEIEWRKLIGIGLFRVGLSLWGMDLVLIPATFALYFYGLDDKVGINLYVWWTILILGFFWLVESLLIWRKDKMFGLARLIVRDKQDEFWTAFRLATGRQWAFTMLATVAPYYAIMLGFHGLSWSFGVKIPLLEFLVVAPLAMAIVDLPIAFAGFGTTTLGWMTFFKDYGPVEDIAALTLFIPFARSAVRALLGLISLRPALRDVGGLLESAKSIELAKKTIAETLRRGDAEK